MMMSQVSMRSVNNWNAENKRNVQPSFGAKVPKLAKFEVIDEKLWESYTKQKDPLSEKIVRMSAKWANLMEKEMKSGKKLEEIARKTSYKACDDCTGYMFSFIVKILSTVWKHGEELRKLHNAKYEYSGPGVVNPAILKIEI